MVFKAYIDSKNNRILISKKDHDELHQIPLELVFEYQDYFCLPIVEEV